MQYSTLAATQVTTGATRPETTEFQGRVRVAVVDTKLTAADTNITLVRMPAGRIRILGYQSAIAATLATAATTVKVGVSAYNKLDGTAVVADDDALLAATAASGTASGKPLVTGGYSGVKIESMSGFDITATLSANGAADDTIIGAILYVID